MVEVPDLVTSARIIDEVGKGDEVLGFVGGTGRMSVHASDTGGNSNSSTRPPERFCVNRKPPAFAAPSAAGGSGLETPLSRLEPSMRFRSSYRVKPLNGRPPQ
jgi:hypothetical protein